MAFVKLDCGILNSTIWIDRDARELFITALLMAEPFELKEPVPQIEIRTLNETGFVVPPGWYGFIPAAGPGIVRRAGMDSEIGLSALERLGAPEAESRTPDFDGRRLIRVAGGFIALNFDKYRQKDHSAAERSRRYRERRIASRVTNVTQRVTDRDVTQAEAEAEAEAEASKTVSRAPALPDEDWLTSLSHNAAYCNIDVPTHIAKCRLWCETNRKMFNRRRLINWLNRIETSIGSQAGPQRAAREI